MSTVGGLLALEIRQSKVDQEGHGEIMPLAHICDGQACAFCPPCALRRQVALRTAAGAKGKSPLFVDEQGARFTLPTLTKLVEAMASRLGQQLLSRSGNARFGTHKFRVSGACYLFLKGAGEDEVMRAGRWSSVESMRKYLRGVPRFLNAHLPARLLGTSVAASASAQGFGSGQGSGDVTMANVTQAAVDSVTVEKPLSRSSKMCFLGIDIASGHPLKAFGSRSVHYGRLDHLVTAEQDQVGSETPVAEPLLHLRELADDELLDITACRLPVGSQLSLQQCKKADISRVCEECARARNFDKWISFISELGNIKAPS